MDLVGKKAIVFGGTSGIGLATTKRLTAAGASVVAISRNPDRASDLGGNVTLEACDVLDKDAVKALLDKHAPYDILISAATGGARAVGPFMEMDMDGFQASFAKLWGYANVVRYGANHLSENGAAVLVSGMPARKCKPGQVALSAVGGAVEALVKAVAVEIAPKRLNVVSPGFIDTPINPLEGDAREEMYRKINADHPIPRAGTADEVAQGIMLCVENDFMTGTTIDVDGGWLVA